MGKKLYNVNGAKFEVDERYSIIKPIGYGAYGFVWYVLHYVVIQQYKESIYTYIYLVHIEGL